MLRFIEVSSSDETSSKGCVATENHGASCLQHPGPTGLPRNPLEWGISLLTLTFLPLTLIVRPWKPFVARAPRLTKSLVGVLLNPLTRGSINARTKRCTIAGCFIVSVIRIAVIRRIRPVEGHHGVPGGGSLPQLIACGSPQPSFPVVWQFGQGWRAVSGPKILWPLIEGVGVHRFFPFGFTPIIGPYFHKGYKDCHGAPARVSPFVIRPFIPRKDAPTIFS